MTENTPRTQNAPALRNPTFPQHAWIPRTQPMLDKLPKTRRPPRPWVKQYQPRPEIPKQTSRDGQQARPSTESESPHAAAIPVSANENEIPVRPASNSEPNSSVIRERSHQRALKDVIQGGQIRILPTLL